MIRLLQFAVIGTIILGVAHGAPAEPKPNCTGDTPDELFCRFRLTEFTGKIDKLNMNNKDELNEFKTSCDSLQKCFANLTYSLQNEKGESALKTVEKYCDALVYLHIDFAKCSEKLNAKKSACFDDWDPVPNGIHSTLDQNKIEQLKKDTCKTYFGKDDCLKKEIIDTCSQQEWNKFRKQFVNLSYMLVSECDFSRLD